MCNPAITVLQRQQFPHQHPANIIESIPIRFVLVIHCVNMFVQGQRLFHHVLVEKSDVDNLVVPGKLNGLRSRRMPLGAKHGLHIYTWVAGRCLWWTWQHESIFQARPPGRKYSHEGGRHFHACSRCRMSRKPGLDAKDLGSHIDEHKCWFRIVAISNVYDETLRHKPGRHPRCGASQI